MDINAIKLTLCVHTHLYNHLFVIILGTLSTESATLHLDCL